MKRNLTDENETLCKKNSQFLEGIRLSIDKMMLLDCGHSWEGTLAAIAVWNAIHVQLFSLSLHTFNLMQMQLYILPINSNLQKYTDYSSSSLIILILLQFHISSKPFHYRQQSATFINYHIVCFSSFDEL